MTDLGHEGLAPIEADEDFDSTSQYEQSLGSSTASLSSSILEHTYENGRRYHVKSEGKYMMPTDETELDRLDMAHHMVLLTLGGEIHRAPVKDPHNVLDCGTGTGIWALDFGALHEESQVIGVDLTPMQPIWTYPNVRFQIDDLEKEWTFQKNFFDFIHSRTLGASIKDWTYYTQQMFDHCKPGGYVELCEHSFTVECDDGSVKEDSGYIAYMDTLREGLKRLGTSAHLFSPAFFRQHLEEAGFVDVEVYTYKVPWGAWPKNKKSKEIGRFCQEVFTSGAEAYALLLMIRVLEMPEDKAKALCRNFVETSKSGKEHAYHLNWHVVARKPKA